MVKFRSGVISVNNALKATLPSALLADGGLRANADGVWFAMPHAKRNDVANAMKLTATREYSLCDARRIDPRHADWNTPKKIFCTDTPTAVTILARDVNHRRTCPAICSMHCDEPRHETAHETAAMSRAR